MRFARACTPVLLMLALPPLLYYLWICVAVYNGMLFVPTSTENLLSLLRRIPAPTPLSTVIFGGWLLLQSVLMVAGPGKVQLGTALADGTRLTYKMNGWFSFCFTLVFLFAAGALGWIPNAFFNDQLGPLLTTANIFAFAFSLFLYLRGKMNLENGTGNAFYDYFFGTQLNPRLGNFDFKFFCESRPGLIGWTVLNFALAARQYEIQGRVTTPMALVLAFQFLYVADFFWNEEAILTTWDIQHERFGWMLCWGNLVWVPFAYTLQAQYLVNRAHDLPVWGIAALILLNLTGYAIFRGANIQKHRFRKDPAALIWGKKPRYITTAWETPLLIDGWWGVARHANYLGDLIMALAWCLPCLFEHPLPYFYFAYLLILLLQRERQDQSRCLAKYGADWEQYSRRVRWRILPGIY